jgi:hypothetical protein
MFDWVAIINLLDHYPGSRDGAEYTNALRDFLFWCRHARVNPVPIAVEGIRAAGYWIEEEAIEQWTILSAIEDFDAIVSPDSIETSDQYSDHVAKYVAVAGSASRDDAVKFFCTIAEALPLDQLYSQMKAANRVMTSRLGTGGVIYPDEFYSLNDVALIFRGIDFAKRVMSECGIATDGNISGSELLRWMKRYPGDDVEVDSVD